MSASDKKKLRKELNPAALTEKQQTEKKEQKKMKTYTLTFVIAMALVLVIVLTSVLQMPVTNLLKANTVAVKVGNHELDAAQFDYFYYDAISEFYSLAEKNGFSSYPDLYFQIYYNFIPSQPLEDQKLPGNEEGKTWADYFIESATEQARWTYALYDLAIENKHTMTESELKTVESAAAYMELYATFSGASSTDAYVKSIYGSSATLDGYVAYNEICSMAQSYARKTYEGFDFKDEDIRARDEKNPGKYSSYSWLSYSINVNSYLKGGEKVTGEDGKVTTVYSDEEKAAALAAAKADAEALKNSASADKEAFDKAINALEINKPAEDAKDPKPIESVDNKALLYAVAERGNENVAKWLADKDRKAGDLDYIEVTSGEDDDKTVTGFIVVLFNERIENTMNVGTVRHLLVKFEGGKKNPTTNEMEYTEAEKKAARAEAEKYLKEYTEGEKQDEEAFSALVKKYSDDSSKSSGGLFENITPDSGYVENFTKWATAEHKKGDVEIIETEYGYHIMFYVEANEFNYRDMMINNELVNEAYDAWEKSAVDAVTATIENMTFADTDYVISK